MQTIKFKIMIGKNMKSCIHLQFHTHSVENVVIGERRVATASKRNAHFSDGVFYAGVVVPFHFIVRPNGNARTTEPQKNAK